MSLVAAPSRSSPVSERLRRDADEYLELVVGDLPFSDITGRLRRLGYVRDRLSLAFSKEAARLSAEFRVDETADRLDAPTAGEWIRHNCKMKSGAAYDSISVGEQLPRVAKCAQAMVDGEIGFAHLSVIARTASALSTSAPESVFPEDDLLANARESSAGRLWHYCQRLRHALDRESVEQEHRVAVEERRLQLSVWEDGSVQISGQLDPVGGAALRTALEPLARPMGESDDRSLEHRQGDAIVELSLHSLDAGFVGGRHGVLDSRVGDDRAAAGLRRQRRPGRLRSRLGDRRRRPSSSGGLRRNPTSPERSRPTLPVARMRTASLVECRSSPCSLDSRWRDRSIQPAPALSSTPLDGSRRRLEVGPLG